MLERRAGTATTIRAVTAGAELTCASHRRLRGNAEMILRSS